ncbi:MAG: NPCBM/NEW2 domain-containing protein [Planctomycetota bacterium]
MTMSSTTTFLATVALLQIGLAGPLRAQATVRAVDGTRSEGVVAGLESDTLLLQAAGKTLRFPLPDVVSLRLSGSGGPPTGKPEACIELVGGDRLQGWIRGGDGEVIEIETASLGRLRVEIDLLRGLTLGGAGRAPDPIEVYEADPGRDVLYRRLEKGLDSLRGTLESFGSGGFVFDCALGRVTFSYAETAALLLVPGGAEPSPTARTVELDLRDGSALRGALLELTAGSIAIRPSFTARLTIPFSVVDVVRFSSPRHAYLSDMEPIEVVQLPFVGGPESFRFPWRRDRTVTGRPLRVGRQPCGKGLGVHSRCRLTYDLSAGWSRFEVAYGLADEVLELRHQGAMIFRVLVDGQVAFESGVVRGGDPPRPAPRIEVKGKQRLSLEADFGPDFDVADRGVWIEPLLVR